MPDYHRVTTQQPSNDHISESLRVGIVWAPFPFRSCQLSIFHHLDLLRSHGTIIFWLCRHGDTTLCTLTKLVLGMMGQLRPKSVRGGSKSSIILPSPQKQGGLPLMEALAKRHSAQECAPDALPLQLLSEQLWAAYGINRPDGGRTAPSALLVMSLTKSIL
jgi:hypothetical protein